METEGLGRWRKEKNVIPATSNATKAENAIATATPLVIIPSAMWSSRAVVAASSLLFSAMTPLNERMTAPCWDCVNENSDNDNPWR